MSINQDSESLIITPEVIKYISHSQQFIIDPLRFSNSVNESKYSESMISQGMSLLKVRLKSIQKIFSLQGIKLDENINYITLQLFEQEEIQEPLNSSNGRLFREINHMKKRKKIYYIRYIQLKLLVKENKKKLKKNDIETLDILFQNVEDAIKFPEKIKKTKFISQSQDLNFCNYDNKNDLLPKKLTFANMEIEEKKNEKELNENKQKVLNNNIGNTLNEKSDLKQNINENKEKLNDNKKSYNSINHEVKKNDSEKDIKVNIKGENLKEINPIIKKTENIKKLNDIFNKNEINNIDKNKNEKINNNLNKFNYNRNISIKDEINKIELKNKKKILQLYNLKFKEKGNLEEVNNKKNNNLNAPQKLKSVLKKQKEEILLKDNKGNSIYLSKNKLVNLLNEINQNTKKEDEIIEIEDIHFKIIKTTPLSLLSQYLKNFISDKIKDKELLFFSYSKNDRKLLELIETYDYNENQILIPLNDLLNFSSEEKNDLIEVKNYNDPKKEYTFSPFKNIIKEYLLNNTDENLENNRKNNYKITSQILYQHSNEKQISYKNIKVNELQFQNLPSLIKILDDENNPHLIREDELKELKQFEELTDLLTEEKFKPMINNIIEKNPLSQIYPLKDTNNEFVFIPYIYLKYHLNFLQKSVPLPEIIKVYDINGDEKEIKLEEFKKLIDLTYIGLCLKTIPKENKSDFVSVNIINGDKVSLPIKFLKDLKLKLINEQKLNKKESFFDKNNNLISINPFKIRPKFLSFIEREIYPYSLKDEEDNSYYPIFNFLNKKKELICKKDILSMINNTNSQFYNNPEKKFCVEELKMSLNPKNDDNIFVPIKLSNEIYIFLKKIFIFKCIDRLTKNKNITPYIKINEISINLKENLLNIIEKTPSLYIKDDFLNDKNNTYIDLSIDNKYNFEKTKPSIENDLFEFIEIKDIHEDYFLIRKPFLRSHLFNPLLINNIVVNDINNKKRIICLIEIINNYSNSNYLKLNIPENNKFIQYKNTFIPSKLYNKIKKENQKKNIKFKHPLTQENINIEVDLNNENNRIFILIKDNEGKLNLVYESALLNKLIEAGKNGDEIIEIINSKMEKIKINVHNIYTSYNPYEYFQLNK